MARLCLLLTLEKRGPQEGGTPGQPAAPAQHMDFGGGCAVATAFPPPAGERRQRKEGMAQLWLLLQLKQVSCNCKHIHLQVYGQSFDAG